MPSSSPSRNPDPQRLSRLLRVIVITSTVLVVVVLVNQLQSYASFRRFADQDIELTRLSGQIVYFDEVLTMSARMAAITGDTTWEERYYTHEQALHAALGRAAYLAPEEERQFLRSVGGVNQELVDREMRTFELIDDGRLVEATQLVFDDEYERLKGEYLAGVTGLRASFDARVGKSLRDAKAWTIFGGGAGLLAVGGTLTILLLSVVRSRREAALMIELATVERRSTLGRLAASLAHELNQPLAAIVNYTGAAQHFQEREDQREELVNAIDGASEQAQRAGEIVRRMREFSKPARPVTAVVDPSQLVKASVLLVQGKSRAVRVPVEVTGSDPCSGLISVDPIQVQQVLVNLLINAIDASPEGNTVEIGASCDGSWCTIRVRDRGIGISHEDTDRVFEAFYSTKDEGQGLGLAISRDIVESLGGVIEVDAQGPGATFYVRFPEADQ